MSSETSPIISITSVNISTNAFRPSSFGTIELQLSLESLVRYPSELKSSTPLDRIYSVLSIASDGPKLDEKALIQLPPGLQYKEALQIDYAADVLDVYQTFVVRAIKLSHSSDIICRNWGSSVSASVWNLPTWV